MIAPYIFPSKHHWEAFKHQTAECGRTAVSNAVLAISLLRLMGREDPSGARHVAYWNGRFRAISARDDHASRAVENCPWLQKTLGRIVLNPERISRAITIARAFTTRTAPEWGEEENESVIHP